MRKFNLKNLSRSEKLRYLLFLLMGISFVFLIVYPVYGIDVWFWLYRIDALGEYIRNYGILALPMRITESAYAGYGYGAPLFYGDIFLMIPSLFVAAGAPLLFGYCILSLELWGGRFFIAYFSARYLLKRIQINTLGEQKYVALVFAFLYQFFPYMVECLISRAAMGEVSAGMILPLIVSSFCAMIFSEKAEKKDAVLLAVGMSVLVCSHVLSTAIICCVMAVFLLCHIRTFLGKKRMKYLLAAVGLTIVLTAYWSLPFVEQMLQSYVTVNGVAGGSSLYGSRVTLVELLFPNLAYSLYFLYRNGYDMGINSFWPSCYIYILLLAVILCIFKKEKWKDSMPMRLVGYSCIIAVFVSFGALLRIADKIPFLRVLQFPWRLLLLVSVFLAVGLTYYYFKFESKTVKNVILWVTFGCAVISGARNVYLMVTDGKEVISSALEEEGASSFADTLYQPKGANKAQMQERGDVVLSSDPALNYAWNRENGKIVLAYSNCTQETVLELPLLYYYGYSTCDSENGGTLSVEKSEDGLVEVKIGEHETGTITVSYTGTKVQHISNWISLFGWIAIIIFFGVQGKNTRRERTRN